MRASFEAIEHRRAVQEYWLEDWKHRGPTLDAASELVGAGKKNATWAKEWFKGYSAPYLDRTPPTSVKWPARAWGWLSGGDAPRRRAGKKYVARNVAPLAAATRRFLEGGVSERRLVEEPRRRTRAVGGRGAGAPEAFRAFRGETPRRRRAKPPSDAGDGPPLGGRLTAAQQERERARREAERREALAASVRGREPVRIRRERRRRSRSGRGATGASVDASASENKRAGPRRRDALFRAFKNSGTTWTDGHARRRRGRRVRVRDSAGGHGAARRGCGREGRCLAPLHATALDFVVGQLAHRDALTDDARSVRLMEGPGTRCHDLLSRAERRRAALGEVRGAYVAATRALEGACEEMEKAR